MFRRDRQVGSRQADVVLEDAGYTGDGKPLFKVIPVHDVPPETHSKPKRGKGGFFKSKLDDFRIVRPMRDSDIQSS